MHPSRTTASRADAVDPAPGGERVVDGHWRDDVPDEQELTSRIIRRSLMCAELAEQGYADADQAVRHLSSAVLAAEFDRTRALRLAHVWLGRHIPSGRVEGRSIDDVDRWRERIAGPDGSEEDRRWLAWALALAAAELSARILPWDASAGALLDLLVAAGYDPSPWERREWRRCRS